MDPNNHLRDEHDPGHDSGHDSGHDDDAASSCMSVASSIFDYEERYSRSYHAFRRGKYPIPNDMIEQERMRLHHESIRTLLGKYWLSPCQPTKILDIGTGTGLWAMEIAELLPDAQVIGVDLSPIQPPLVPQNLYFEIMDAQEYWYGFDEKFNFIHTQFMNGMSIRAWRPFYKQARMSLLPGGWIENHEVGFSCLCEDGEVPPEHAFLRWTNLWNNGLEKLGMTGRCDETGMEDWLREEGFVNVTVRSYRMPIGAWSTDNDHKKAGSLFLEGLLNDISGLSLKPFLDGLQWSRTELEILLWKVRREFEKCQHRLYMPLYVISVPQIPSHANDVSFVLTGQKPLEIQL
jgi:SAM-dependent methyltransferase